jgi:hypothetical protein
MRPFKGRLCPVDQAVVLFNKSFHIVSSILQY